MIWKTFSMAWRETCSSNHWVEPVFRILGYILNLSEDLNNFKCSSCATRTAVVTKLVRKFAYIIPTPCQSTSLEAFGKGENIISWNWSNVCLEKQCWTVIGLWHMPYRAPRENTWCHRFWENLFKLTHCCIQNLHFSFDICFWTWAVRCRILLLQVI